MKKVIKCVDENCDHEEPANQDEWMYKTTLGIGRAVRDQGYMVLCSACDCQTILIEKDDI